MKNKINKVNKNDEFTRQSSFNRESSEEIINSLNYRKLETGEVLWYVFIILIFIVFMPLALYFKLVEFIY